MASFGGPSSLIAFYEYQLEMYLKIGVGGSTYEEGYQFAGVVITENLINATRRRLIQLRLKKKNDSK